MAAPYDVAARLAEGRPTVDDLEQYVAACRRLGYQHRDLMMGPTPLRDWYGGEEGMDLGAIEADHAALSAAAAAAEDAAHAQAELVSQVAAAWTGRGAAAAHEFLWRSGQTAITLTRQLRAAADAMAVLRDALWRAVDAKVVATEAVEERQQPQRAEWLGAAATVTTGAGDVAAASELVDQRVRPFVDLDVGSVWIAAMRAAVVAVDAAYDAAVAGIVAPPVTFGVPSDLGPRAQPASQPAVTDRGPSAPVVAAQAAPTVFGVAPQALPPVSPAPVTPAQAAVPSLAPIPPADAAALPMGGAGALPSMPSVPSLGDLGAGSSTLGSGLSGFGRQLADLIGGLVGSADGGGLVGSADGGGLVGSADGGSPEADDATDPAADDTGPSEPDAKAKDGKAEPEVDSADEPTTEPDPADSGVPDADVPDPAPDAAATPDVEPVPTQVPEPPPAPPSPDPVPDAEAVALPDGAPTPCQIAADQLPQVGE